MMRIGHGYDVHRLTEGRRLVLGGVEEGVDTGKVQERVRVGNREEGERTERLSDHAYRYSQAEDRVEFLEE